MRFLFVMDSMDALDVEGDTTLALIKEADARGHEVWCAKGIDVSLEHEQAFVEARPLKRAAERLELGSCDAVFLREDPPFDANYLYTTLLCEAARGRTLFVNDPRGLRDANEKLFAMRFPELVPPTIVTRDRARLRAFVREQGGVAVVKPIDGRGGEGVFIARTDDLNLNAILETATGFGQHRAIAQRYVPEVRAGDKRILLLNGEILGAVLRVPREDDARANLHIGGRAVRTDISARDRAICERIAPALRECGLHFVGIDVIGDWLTEINVTSPTGLRQINALEGVRLERKVIDWVTARAKGESNS